MDINEVNKKLYEDAFISNGEYGDLNNWKPSIDEREIEESCEKEDGTWIPATPLGYRDYEISRLEGIKNILSQESSRVFTYDDAHNIKREDGILKLYDKITLITDTTNDVQTTMDLVVVGDDENNFYVVDKENHRYYIEYIN